MFELEGRKCVDGFINGWAESDGGGIPKGKACVVDGSDDCRIELEESPGPAAKKVEGID